jgi:hypothetical protein
LYDLIGLGISDSVELHRNIALLNGRNYDWSRRPAAAARRCCLRLLFVSAANRKSQTQAKNEADDLPMSQGQIPLPAHIH